MRSATAPGRRRPLPWRPSWPADEGAVLSHDSAAALWGLRRWPQLPEITSERRVDRPGIAAHRSSTLTDADITVERGIPATTAGRTLRDIRPRIGTRRRYERLVNQVRLDHHLDSDDAAQLLGHRHNATRSGGEDTLWHFCRRRHLPEPQLNVRVAGREVDALFEAEKLVVEIDHPATHGDPASREADPVRDADLAAAGYQVIRLTEQRLLDHPKAEAARLRRILEQRRVYLRRDG